VGRSPPYERLTFYSESVLDPEPRGYLTQIIIHDHEVGSEKILANSFEGWFEAKVKRVEKQAEKARLKKEAAKNK
jgi:hypothetical protein